MESPRHQSWNFVLCKNMLSNGYFPLFWKVWHNKYSKYCFLFTEISTGNAFLEIKVKPGYPAMELEIKVNLHLLHKELKTWSTWKMKRSCIIYTIQFRHNHSTQPSILSFFRQLQTLKDMSPTMTCEIARSPTKLQKFPTIFWDLENMINQV